jgi:hypothetical protein
MADDPAALPEPKKRKKRGSPKKLFLLLLPLLLLGGTYGAAKTGKLPLGTLAAKNPGAKKVIAALGLASGEHKKTAKHGDKSAHKEAAVRAAKDGHGAEATLPPPPPIPASRSAEKARPKKPKDNTGRVVAILSTMDVSAVAAMVGKMRDAEAAPLLLKMKPGLAGEVLAALPPARALTLTRYLRRYPG